MKVKERGESESERKSSSAVKKKTIRWRGSERKYYNIGERGEREKYFNNRQ